jgi:archaeal flagellin FlaB
MSMKLGALKNERGITGLETAIILIAFVIVASVLAYVVISSGLFSSQKAKDAVNAGIEQTRATLEVKSDVVVQMEGGFATKAFFTVGVVPGGSAVDLTDYYGTTNPTPTALPSATITSTDPPSPFVINNRLIISYFDNYHIYPSLPWSMQMINNNNGDAMLDPGELAQITVYISYVNAGANPSATPTDCEKLGPYHSFTLEIKPPDGSILTIERTLPSRVSSLVNLR